MSAKRKLSPRAARRAAERELDKLAKSRAALAALEPGGSAERPIEVASASLVEIEARAARCTRCDGGVQLEEHVVERTDWGLLRVARIACPICGTRRNVWFRIAEPS